MGPSETNMSVSQNHNFKRNRIVQAIFKFQVVYFRPQGPVNQEQVDALSGLYGVQVTPELDASFYVDLGAKAIGAVESMKNAGTWPDISYVKCVDKTDHAPTIRSVDLMNALKVSMFKICLIKND